MTKCKVVLLFSGKRKSGKDYITELLASRLREKAIILRLVAIVILRNVDELWVQKTSSKMRVAPWEQ